MSSGLRKEVLRCFKSIHRARQKVFDGDELALNKGRERINEEFKKYISVTDADAIKELILHSKAVETELLKTVIQAKEVEPGRYEVRLRPEIDRLDNIPFKDCPA